MILPLQRALDGAATICKKFYMLCEEFIKFQWLDKVFKMIVLMQKGESDQVTILTLIVSTQHRCPMELLEWPNWIQQRDHGYFSII